MNKQPTLEELRAELERQNEQLAEVEAAAKRLDAVDVPPTFWAEFEEACSVKDTSKPQRTEPSILVGVRA